MRLQITIEPHTKLAAEAKAREMGYSSLTALLQVLAHNLAREGMKRGAENPRSEPNQQQTIPVPPRKTPPPPTLEPTIVQQPTLPAPEQFTVWPKHLDKSIWRTDPELYLFYIQVGQIR